MNMAVVGAARIVFGADTSDFDKGAKGVEGTLGRLIDKFGEFERRLKNIGTGMTLGITVPFAAMTRAVDKGAGSFEGQMKRVEAALGNVSGAQLKELSDLARDLGPKVGKGATEAASAIEALGLAGVSTSDIMGGALKAALDLSAAGMVDAESSASLVTDIMGQFKVSAGQLPGVVQKVVGALDTSKFGFDDFRLAVGQGGSVAAAAGVGFLDFATAISATSTQFTSGADAGTSFKTYIQSLTGKSKEAQGMMQKLGISFYDASGQMKPVGEQAQMLREKLSNLTDEAKGKALETIFGSDSSRIAIGLMEQGAEGFNMLQEAIAGGDVEAKIQKRMEGSEAAGKRIANAWESVKIALGLDTGFLGIVTSIKNGFASLLESVAGAPPVFLKIGAAFSGIAAAIGPLMMVVGHLGALFLAHFAASKFGMIGKAIALVISPISTLAGMLGEMGLARVLAMAGSRLLALLGPVGVAISLFIMFKDYIMTALQAVWKTLTETLGPPLEAMFAKVGELFGALSGGPIGSALQGLISMLVIVKDVIGTVLVGAIMLAGEVIARVLGAAIAIISGFIDIITGMVEIVSALLTGDFSGAWEAAQGVVTAVWDTIIAVISAIVPEIAAELEAVYSSAKQWLGDGFQSVVDWFTGLVQSAVNYVSTAFPNVVAAAKSVYQGVKSWLVDKFGGIMTWIGNAAKWIGDQYTALKNRLGLGGGGSGGGASAPPEPPAAGTGGGGATAPEPPKQTVDFGGGGGGGGSKGKKKAGGGGSRAKEHDPAKDAADRAQIEQDVALDAARLRGDRETEQVMRRQMELAKQIEAYQRTGLTLEAATAAAKKDMAILDEARLQGMAKELQDDTQAHKLELARISGNRTMEESLQRQHDLKQSIDRFLRDGLTLEQATARALQQQLELDAARAEVRQKLLTDDEQDRQLALAKARGDSDERIRQLQRQIDIRNRQRELENDMDPDSAKDQASREWDEMEKARQTGVFRDTFKDGVRAALDGDLKGWVKNFWQDRIARGMEDALNSLADLISQLFSNIGGSGGGGGGFFGALGSIFGGAFGGGAKIDVLGNAGGPISVIPDNSFTKVPGFKTGGSFKVGGRSGIDANMISFRATKGEMVNIQRPGNDAGPNGQSVTIDLSGVMVMEEALTRMDQKAASYANVAVINERRANIRKNQRRF